MRRLGLIVVYALLVALGAAGAGGWWVAHRTPRWSLLVQQRDGNLALADLYGNQRQLTTDADGRTLAYLHATPAPDGRSVATVAARAGGTTTPLIVHELDGASRTLYDERNSNPFYLSWSPDGQKLAFLASDPRGMALHAVPASGGESARELALGQPSYFAWSPDSQRILMHIGGGTRDDSLLLYDWGGDLPAALPAQPAFFNAPGWLPDNERALVVLRQNGKAALATIDSSGATIKQLAELDGGTVFVPAPDVAHVAYLALDRAGLPQLHLVNTEDGDDRTVERGQTFAFFWSPLGDRVAFLSTADEARPVATQTTPQVRWNIANVADGSTRSFPPFTPSQAFVNILLYFDQYAHSIRLWDPSGQQLTYGASDGVYVLNLASGQPQKIGDGVLGVWLHR